MPLVSRFAAVRAFILLAALPCAATPSIGQQVESRRFEPSLGLGIDIGLSGSHQDFLILHPVRDPSVTPEHPLYMRLLVPWRHIERRAGEYDWRWLDRLVDQYRSANHVIVLVPHGRNVAIDPRQPLPDAASPVVLKHWLEFLRATAFHFEGRVRYYEIWDEPNREPEWSGAGVVDYAYLLKNSSVTVRSADPDAMIVQGGLAMAGGDTAALDWQEALFSQETATYVDVLSVHPADGPPFAGQVGRLYDLLLTADPSAQLWVTAVPLRGAADRARAAELIEGFVSAQGNGAAVVTFALQREADRRPELPGVLLDLHKLFLPAYGLVHGGRLKFEAVDAAEAPQLPGVTSFHFFDAESFQGLVVYFASSPGGAGRGRLVIDTAAVRGVVIYDIIGGAAGPVSSIEPDFGANTTRVPVPLRDRPLVLQYARVPIQGFEAEHEALQVADTGLITVEEILANHQRFMADQTFRLRNIRADGRVTYHYGFGGQTIDVRTDNTFYWDLATGAEWEQRALYFNGVLWKHEKAPELPFIQPDKVVTLPLDINLNKDYTYEYAGVGRAGEFDCYIVKFRPLDETKSRYQGKVWFEKRTFARVRISSVQTNLESPVVSSEQVDSYLPIAGPDGTTYWILTRVDGQEIFSTAGRNLILTREIDFSGFLINGDDFDAARQRAYDSERQMLRDTERGLRYLEKTDDGGRQVTLETRDSTLFAVLGIYDQEGLDYPIPLAGVNYFDYRVGGRDLQINAFLAGLVNTFTLTNPSLFDRPVDATVEALVFIPGITDRYTLNGEERQESHVDERRQSLSGSLGSAIGNFFKVKGTYWLQYVNYTGDDDTNTFTVPSDTLIHSLGLQGEFNRRTWSISAFGERSRRATWEPWGDTTTPPSAATQAAFPGAACDSPGSCFADFDPGQDTFDRYEFRVTKQWFLPWFQKILLSGSWLDGSNLDRFSQYQFRFFGTRLPGLSGSGVRFDRGGIARAQYSFNIAEAIRFNASLDHARVRDSLTTDEYHDFSGVALSGTTLGPWRSFIQFDVGVTVQSDFPDLEGNHEIQVILLKFF
jgi:hypothetical protein